MLVKNNIGKEEIYEELINNPKEFKEKFNYLDDPKIISLEGFLYPSTYYFKEDESEKEVLSQMLKTFQSKYSEEFQKRQKELNKSLYEVVNLASIVEKEAVLDEDRPIIASVFYNRMNIRYRLHDLACRFEPPSPLTRWDTPLFRICLVEDNENNDNTLGDAFGLGLNKPSIEDVPSYKEIPLVSIWESLTELKTQAKHVAINPPVLIIISY